MKTGFNSWGISSSSPELILATVISNPCPTFALQYGIPRNKKRLNKITANQALPAAEIEFGSCLRAVWIVMEKCNAWKEWQMHFG